MIDWYEKLLEGLYYNPLSRGEFVLMDGKQPVAGFTPHAMSEQHWGPKHVHLEDLRALRKGGGKQLMELICTRADELGITFSGLCKPLDSQVYGRKMALKKLLAWYKAFGFESQGGNSEHGYDIIRKPRGYKTNPIFPKDWDHGHKPDNQVRYKRGDQVRVKESPGREFGGWIGTVVMVRKPIFTTPLSYKVWFNTGGFGMERWLYPHELEDVEFADNPVFPKEWHGHQKFKVGDVVVITHGGWKHVVGRIEEIHPNNTQLYLIRYDARPHSVVWVTNDMIEHFDMPGGKLSFEDNPIFGPEWSDRGPKFRRWAYVRVTNPLRDFFGWTGQIQQVRGKEGDVHVYGVYFGVIIGDYTEDELELAQDKPIIGPPEGEGEYTENPIFDKEWMSRRGFWEAPKDKQHPIGTKVKPIDPEAPQYDRKGVIDFVRESSSWPGIFLHRVDFGWEQKFWYLYHELEVIPPP